MMNVMFGNSNVRLLVFEESTFIYNAPSGLMNFGNLLIPDIFRPFRAKTIKNPTNTSIKENQQTEKQSPEGTQYYNEVRSASISTPKVYNASIKENQQTEKQSPEGTQNYNKVRSASINTPKV
ncbi:MAG TPA: hypothetical protein PKY29_01775 [Ferruginibacter sp.]|nr:hypothetical protein [Ferruginibacter sp.]HRQ20011.1 hypothetical protein [Ferruginibacter sp.]